MVVKNAGIQFHRRSRYEDILELVNDNEDALKPFPNRDAVFYKQSNKGTRFDGKDHLDKLKIQEKQIAEAIARDLMKRQYAEDNDTTYKAFTQHDRPEPEQPRTPEQFNIGTDPDDMSYIEEYGTPQEQQLFQINETLGNIATAQQSNQQAIYQAHQQQLEREEEGGSGILRSLGSGALSLGSGALRVGGNVAGNMVSGMDFGSSLLAGMSQEAISAFNEAIMNRINPPPRPLLDFTGDPRAGQFTTYDPMPIPNMQYLQPSIILQPHQPNVGATQQPLPIASSSQPTVSELPALPAIPRPIPQRPTEPRGKTRPRPSPKTSPEPPRPNFQQGGSQSSRASGAASSSSSGNAPPPEPPQPPPFQKDVDISKLYKESRNVLFSGWGSINDSAIINELSELPLHDYSRINPKNISSRTLQTLFNIAKIRNQLSPIEEEEINKVIDKNNKGGSTDEKEERVIKLFNDIFKERTPYNAPRKTPLTRKTNMKEGTTEEQERASPTLIIPSKIGIQKLREVFEEANNRNTINTKTYRSYKSLYNKWVKSAGDKDMKKQHLQELKDLYRQNIYKK